MKDKTGKSAAFIVSVFRAAVVLCGAAAMTMFFFMVLPLMQTLGRPPQTDMMIRSLDIAKLEAPPPPPEIQQEEEEPEQQETPPKLAEDAPPLELSQLELVLNPTVGEGLMAGDFALRLNASGSDGKSVDELFSIADLDQKPRVIYQPGPLVSRELKRRAPATVYVMFIVDQRGRVQDPIIQRSSDPSFERPALAAVRQWRFEPGKRNGQPVRFRMRVPISFPKGD